MGQRRNPVKMGLFDANEDEPAVIDDLASELTDAGVENLMTDHVVDGRGAAATFGDRRADLSFDHPGRGTTYIEVDDERDDPARRQLDDMAADLGPGDRLLSVTDDDVRWWEREPAARTATQLVSA